MVKLIITDIGKNLYTVVRGKLECGFKYHDHYDELDSSKVEEILACSPERVLFSADVETESSSHPDTQKNIITIAAHAINLKDFSKPFDISSPLC